MTPLGEINLNKWRKIGVIISRGVNENCGKFDPCLNIGCDVFNCKIQRFHMRCVNIYVAPKGA